MPDVLFKMADTISMSQRALPKVTSQRYIPSNVTLKKQQKSPAFYELWSTVEYSTEKRYYSYCKLICQFLDKYLVFSNKYLV